MATDAAPSLPRPLPALPDSTKLSKYPYRLFANIVFSRFFGVQPSFLPKDEEGIKHLLADHFKKANIAVEYDVDGEYVYLSAETYRDLQQLRDTRGNSDEIEFEEDADSVYARAIRNEERVVSSASRKPASIPSERRSEKQRFSSAELRQAGVSTEFVEMLDQLTGLTTAEICKLPARVLELFCKLASVTMEDQWEQLSKFGGDNSRFSLALSEKDKVLAQSTTKTIAMILSVLVTIATPDSEAVVPLRIEQRLELLRKSGIIESTVTMLMECSSVIPLSVASDGLEDYQLRIPSLAASLLLKFTAPVVNQARNCTWVVTRRLLGPLFDLLFSSLEAITRERPVHQDSSPARRLRNTHSGDELLVQLGKDTEALFDIILNITGNRTALKVFQSRCDLMRQRERTTYELFERALADVLRCGIRDPEPRFHLRTIRLVRNLAPMYYRKYAKWKVLHEMLQHVPSRGADYVEDVGSSIIAMNRLHLKQNNTLANAVKVGAIPVFVLALLGSNTDIQEKAALTLFCICNAGVHRPPTLLQRLRWIIYFVFGSTEKRYLRRVEQLLKELDSKGHIESKFTALLRDPGPATLNDLVESIAQVPEATRKRCADVCWAILESSSSMVATGESNEDQEPLAASTPPPSTPSSPRTPLPGVQLQTPRREENNTPASPRKLRESPLKRLSRFIRGTAATAQENGIELQEITDTRPRSSTTATLEHMYSDG